MELWRVALRGPPPQIKEYSNSFSSVAPASISPRLLIFLESVYILSCVALLPSDTTATALSISPGAAAKPSDIQPEHAGHAQVSIAFGGVFRDVLLHRDIALGGRNQSYGLAAGAGAATYVAMRQLHVHVYDGAAGFTTVQTMDHFGETAGIGFSPDCETLFVGVADLTYGSVLEYNRARHGAAAVVV